MLVIPATYCKLSDLHELALMGRIGYGWDIYRKTELSYGFGSGTNVGDGDGNGEDLMASLIRNSGNWEWGVWKEFL